MKRIILMFVFLTSMSLVSHAQFRYGFKAGGNISNINMKVFDKNEDIYRLRGGFHAGMMADYSFSQKFGLQTEILYMQNGANLRQALFSDYLSVDGLGMEGKTVLNQIQLPLYLKFRFPISDKIKIYAMAGGFVDYVFDGKMTIEASYQNQSSSIDWDLFADAIAIGEEKEPNYFRTQHWNYGAAFEMGIEISKKITIGANYKHILSDMSSIRTSLSSGAPFNPTTTMYMVSLSVGYFF